MTSLRRAFTGLFRAPPRVAPSDDAAGEDLVPPPRRVLDALAEAAAPGSTLAALSYASGTLTNVQLETPQGAAGRAMPSPALDVRGWDVIDWAGSEALRLQKVAIEGAAPWAARAPRHPLPRPVLLQTLSRFEAALLEGAYRTLQKAGQDPFDPDLETTVEVCRQGHVFLVRPRLRVAVSWSDRRDPERVFGRRSRVWTEGRWLAPLHAWLKGVDTLFLDYRLVRPSAHARARRAVESRRWPARFPRLGRQSS